MVREVFAALDAGSLRTVAMARSTGGAWVAAAEARAAADDRDGGLRPLRRSFAGVASPDCAWSLLLQRSPSEGFWCLNANAYGE